MPRIARPIFRRHADYVAIRDIRTHSKSVIKAGEDVKLRPHQMRTLYQRRRIGLKGHPWTEQALTRQGFPRPFVTPPRPKPAQVDTFAEGFPITTESGAVIDAAMFGDFVATQTGDIQVLAGMDADQKQIMLGEMVAQLDAPASQAILAAQNGGTAAKPEIGAEDAGEDEKGNSDSAGEAGGPVRIKSQWGFPDLTKQKFSSKKKAAAWLQEQTAPDSAKGGE